MTKAQKKLSEVNPVQKIKVGANDYVLIDFSNFLKLLDEMLNVKKKSKKKKDLKHFVKVEDETPKMKTKKKKK